MGWSKSLGDPSADENRVGSELRASLSAKSHKWGFLHWEALTMLRRAVDGTKSCSKSTAALCTQHWGLCEVQVARARVGHHQCGPIGREPHCCLPRSLSFASSQTSL